MKIEQIVKHNQPREYEWLDIWRMTAKEEEVKTVPDDRLTRFFLWLEKLIDKVVER